MSGAARRVTILGVVVAVLTAVVASAPGGAASGAVSTTFAGRAGSVSRATSSQLSANASTTGSGNGTQKDAFVTHPTGHHGGGSASTASTAHSADAGVSTSTSSTLQNFAGLTGADQFNAYHRAFKFGFILEPPDQGLCTGILFGSSVVAETVNDVVGFYTPSGALITPVIDLNSFFGEPFAQNISDPRCVFDAASDTWFFTSVIYPNNLFPNHTDLLVLNGASGAETVYSIDTTFSGDTAGQCPCFGDQPKLGIDANNIYVSTDEYNSPATIDETGAALFALSKSQLVAQGTNVNVVLFENLVLGGIGVVGLQPAITTGGSSVEYLLNSFPYLDEAQTHPNTSSTQLGLWALSNTGAVTSGGVPTLSETTLTSETYGAPVPALTTNGLSLATFSNDSRLQQLQFINGHLWAALDSSVTVDGDTATRDGAAWFEVTPSVDSHGQVSGGLTDQGYVATAGKYILYPAIITTTGGTTGIAFSMTSPTLDPSTGYVIRKAGATSFSGVHLTGAGSGPDIGFTCQPPVAGTAQQCRWGDYSWATLDPSGANLWMAAELTVHAQAEQPKSHPPAKINWGTEVWEVSGT